MKWLWILEMICQYAEYAPGTLFYYLEKYSVCIPSV